MGPMASMNGCRKSRPSSGIRSLDSPARPQRVVIQTELVRLESEDPSLISNNNFADRHKVTVHNWHLLRKYKMTKRFEIRYY